MPRGPRRQGGRVRRHSGAGRFPGGTGREARPPVPGGRVCSRLRGTAGIRVAAAGTSVPFARRGLLCSTRSSPSRRPPTDVWRGFDQPDHESACGRASESAGLAADSRAHLPAGFEAPAGVLIACLEGIQVEQPSTGKGKSGCRCRARPAGASGPAQLDSERATVQSRSGFPGGQEAYAAAVLLSSRQSE